MKGESMATVREEVNERIKKLLDERAAEYAANTQQIAACDSTIREQTTAMQTATEATNVEDYEKAKSAIHKAEVAKEMYLARQEQLNAREIVSEEESDKVIESLLRYNAKLAEDFDKAVLEHLEPLKKIYADYVTEKEALTHTAYMWTQQIRPTYRNWYDVVYGQAVTSSPSRSKDPVDISRYLKTSSATGSTGDFVSRTSFGRLI